LLPIIDSLVPVLTFIGGLGFGYLVELKREDRQRKHAWQESREEMQRKAIEDLQDALGDLHRSVVFAVIASQPDVAARMGLPTGLRADWVRGFEVSDKRVAILAPRIMHPVLRQRINSFLDLTEDAIRGRPYDHEAFRLMMEGLDRSIAEVNALAGRLYADPFANRLPRFPGDQPGQQANS
jgi:hypothetical protein